MDVHRGYDVDKLRSVDQTIGAGTEFALVNEFVESRARDTELACSFGFNELGHASMTHPRVQGGTKKIPSVETGDHEERPELCLPAEIPVKHPISE